MQFIQKPMPMMFQRTFFIDRFGNAFFQFCHDNILTINGLSDVENHIAEAVNLDPVPFKFGNPNLKDIKVPKKQKIARNREQERNKKEQERIKEGYNAACNHASNGEELSLEEFVCQRRESKIIKVLGSGIKMIPTNQYKPFSKGPIPIVDPNSLGFNEYPDETKQIVLSRIDLSNQIRNKANCLLGQYGDDILLKTKPNALRYMLLPRLQKEFPNTKLSFICQSIGLSLRMKVYYDQYPIETDKYAPILDDVKKFFFFDNNAAYGRYRLCQSLRDKYGIFISVEAVRKIMIRLGLKTLVNTNNSKYNSYAGKVGALSSNLLQRNFKADYFGHKVVTDVTEYKLKGLKLYLSAYVDLYTHMVIAYSLSRSPTVEFTSDGLKLVLDIMPKDKPCIIHSDQGHQYQRASYRELFEAYPNIKQSMSRKGNCLDNAHAECFFAQLKREGPKPEDCNSVEELVQEIKSFIYWYNTKRYLTQHGNKSPEQLYQNRNQPNGAVKLLDVA